MKPPSINRKLQEFQRARIDAFEKEYAELIDLMLSQPGIPTDEQIARKNYLETELYILKTNN